nr:collagen-like triple helix repeat-containing protein [Rhizobium sp. Q54]
MIDAKAFGQELAGMVKAQLSPILTRLDALEKRLDAIPAPVDLSDELAALKSAVESIPPVELPVIEAPELPDIGAMVDEAVKAAVAAIPAPQDGKDGVDGRDGVSVAGAFIDRDGSLAITLSNGEVKNLGPVVGKDGRDGFSLEDFDASLMEDGRTVLLSFAGKGMDYKVELGFPAMIYRGVFNDGQKYEPGDTVTWGGSLWHCDEATAEKPGDGSKSWTLCAKKGRDGKDGVMKEAKAAQPVRVGVPSGAN